MGCRYDLSWAGLLWVGPAELGVQAGASLNVIYSQLVVRKQHSTPQMAHNQLCATSWQQQLIKSFHSRINKKESSSSFLEDVFSVKRDNAWAKGREGKGALLQIKIAARRPPS